ncbi:hypothetical protein A9Q99_21410 [Gammaproteobacteria bacterium 45_16_T64]|nr:hypothetical protein A9Q99_21410 [Gammaproteobacteria bacterium 45_16_T64]
MPSDYSDGNPLETNDINMDDVAYCYFNPETAGGPKLLKVTHDKFHRLSHYVSSALLDLRKKDRMYLCLPLYYANTMFSGFGAVVLSGSSMFLSRDFSESKFISEIREYGASWFAYSGSMCNSLMDQKVMIDDHENPITKCVGSGLRADIWVKFKQRYGIDKVGEFYGADEGYGWFFNLLNKDKTVGFCTRNHMIAKYDFIENRVVTGYGGWCRKSKKYETGVLLVEIDEETFLNIDCDRNSKFVHNVLRRGDCYFNTGDLLRRVDVGFSFLLNHYEFVGRVEDYCRWKGANISTIEVSGAIDSVDSVEYCCVYGVAIPGTNERAGMAAIVSTDSELDLDGLSRHINENIPHYARPVFLRELRGVGEKRTMRIESEVLKYEAFHPNSAGDPVFILRPGAENYQLLDAELYQDLISGVAKC